MTNRVLYPLIATGVILLVSLSGLNAQQSPEEAISIGGDDIGGVVKSTKGPEAGVWVIAETADLATKFVKIVVTDDQGRYLVPDLPKANYNLWVRGYGLVDSRKVQAAPGRVLNLTAVVAPTAIAAAHYYPAGYWFSLIKVPDPKEFPGTGAEGNGISANIKSQADWIRQIKSGGCTACATTCSGTGAQRRRHDVGLGGPQDVSARPGLDRQTQTDAQCERHAVRIDRGQSGLPAHAHAGDEHDRPRT